MSERYVSTDTFSGPRKERNMTIKVFDGTGAQRWERTIAQP